MSTPFEMVTLLARIEAIVASEASKQTIAILNRCQDDSGIRHRLSKYPIANKTGALDALRSEVGVAR